MTADFPLKLSSTVEWQFLHPVEHAVQVEHVLDRVQFEELAAPRTGVGA